MKPKSDFFEQQDTSSSRSGSVRGFFHVLTILAGAFLAGFLLLSYLDKSSAPGSPELTAAQPESGVYLSVTPENGFRCSVLPAESAENASAAVWIEAGMQNYRSEPAATKLKLPALALTDVSLDLSALRYSPVGDPSAAPVDAKALIASLPADASARIVFSVNGEAVLFSEAFNPIPFLAGGVYGN